MTILLDYFKNKKIIQLRCISLFTRRQSSFSSMNFPCKKHVQVWIGAWFMASVWIWSMAKLMTPCSARTLGGHILCAALLVVILQCRDYWFALVAWVYSVWWVSFKPMIHIWPFERVYTHHEKMLWSVQCLQILSNSDMVQELRCKPPML